MKDLLKQTLPDHEKVLALGDKIKWHITVPKWINNVTVCYDHEWINREGKRTKPNFGRHCGKFGEYTPEYYDSSQSIHGRTTTRFIRWGLLIDKRRVTWDAWFNQVELCFQVDVPNEWPYKEQCNTGKDLKTNGYKRKHYPDDFRKCVKVNDLDNANFYMDSTNDKNFGCYMSWSVNVPDGVEVPAWFLNLQFCFQWGRFGGGDPRQCGHGAHSNTLCAFVNEYTHAYHDNTGETFDGIPHKKGSGCAMKWRFNEN